MKVYKIASYVLRNLCRRNGSNMIVDLVPLSIYYTCLITPIVFAFPKDSSFHSIFLFVVVLFVLSLVLYMVTAAHLSDIWSTCITLVYCELSYIGIIRNINSMCIVEPRGDSNAEKTMLQWIEWCDNNCNGRYTYFKDMVNTTHGIIFSSKNDLIRFRMSN